MSQLPLKHLSQKHEVSGVFCKIPRLPLCLHVATAAYLPEINKAKKAGHFGH